MGEVVDILLSAKDKIIDGWVPHPPRGVPENCSVTALVQATQEVLGRSSLFSDPRNPEHFAEHLVREAALWGGSSRSISMSLGEWNDSQTDKQVVIDAFDAAIRLAKEREL